MSSARPPFAIGVAFLALGACAPDSMATEGTDGVSDGEADTGASDAGGETTETTDAGDGDAGDGDGTSGGDGDGTSGGDGDGTSAGDGDGDGDVSYIAYELVGALDRIVIVRRDDTADQCAAIRVAMPGGTASQVTAPGNWGYEYGYVINAADGCNPFMPTGDPTFNSSGAMGWVDFEDPGAMIYPCTVDVDVTLEFNMGPMWAPPSLVFDAVDIPVSGGCP